MSVCLRTHHTTVNVIVSHAMLRCFKQQLQINNTSLLVHSQTYQQQRSHLVASCHQLACSVDPSTEDQAVLYKCIMKNKHTHTQRKHMHAHIHTQRKCMRCIHTTIHDYSRSSILLTITHVLSHLAGRNTLSSDGWYQELFFGSWCCCCRLGS